MTNKEEQLLDLIFDLFDDPDKFPNIDITHIEHYNDWVPIRLCWEYYEMPWSIKKITLLLSNNTNGTTTTN